MNYKSIPLLAILILALSAGSLAQTFEKSLDVTRTFPIKKMTTIQVENKYGNINIIPWEKDSVKFDIHLEVTSSKMDRLDKTFKSIDFDFTANEYFIITRTVFKNQKSKFLAELTDMATSLFSHSNAQIDYTIYLPESAELTLDNKYGNVYTTNLTGKLILNISNGDLRANALTGVVRADLEFGDFTVKELKNANIEFNYANAEIRKADKLMIESRSSEIEIDEATEIDINSRRDQINIKSLSRITGDISFSEIYLRVIDKELIMKTEYGGLEIDQVPKDFRLIDLTSQYTDLSLMVSKESQFDLELIHTKESDVTISGFVEVTNTEVLNKDEGVVKVSGFQGKNASSRIRVDLKSGSFKIL